MELPNVPWRDGIATVIAGLFLKMLWDAVYKKIPAGFRSVRIFLKKQTLDARRRHKEFIVKLYAVENAIRHLQKTKCRKTPKKKRAFPAQKKPPTK